MAEIVTPPYKPLPITQAHLRVDLRFLGPNLETAGCRLYYRTVAGGPPTLENIVALSDFFFGAFSPSVLGVLTQLSKFAQVNVEWKGTDEEFDSVSESGQTAGTVAGNILPEEVAVVIQRRTFKKGRNMRGRIFIPFVPLAHVNGSALIVAGMNAYKALGDAMELDRTQSGITYRPCTPNGKTGTLTDVLQCRTVTEVQSRRDRRYPKRPGVYI